MDRFANYLDIWNFQIKACGGSGQSMVMGFEKPWPPTFCPEGFKCSHPAQIGLVKNRQGGGACRQNLSIDPCEDRFGLILAARGHLLRD